LHVACIHRHISRWIASIGCLDPDHTATELRAVWFDVNGIARAAFSPSRHGAATKRAAVPRFSRRSQ
jgi:hypothetical protein